jgi:LysR family glycine cleavage system transcriptional activator
MSARLPSLTALRAFEAAARHMSFAAAAEELSVTPAALSFQIKSLEEALGAPLFVRLTRAVELTAAGRALAPETSRGFEALRAGWKAAQATLSANRLTVTAGPAFTTKWLAPELGRFARAHPDIELRFVTSLAKLDFARDGIDLAVRFGIPNDDGLFSEHFYDDFILPVMRPDIAGRTAEPAGLLDETLIAEESLDFLKETPDWPRWFAAAGVEVPADLKVTAFTQADHAVDAALAGAGVALSRFSIARQALRAGALVAPFAVVLAIPAQFRFVCPLGEEERPAVRAFREYFHAEAAKDADLLVGREVVKVG